MEQDKDYIPRSAKATDFKITLSHSTKEDEERVSFLELQIQQVKAKYESALKNVIEECITLNLKKLSNEIIMGQATEDTVMELGREGTANFEQLKDLIRKECDKQDCRCAHLEDKYKKLEHQVTNHDQQKNMAKRG